ncbi:MAG: hypothetical protein WAU00_15020 [Caldilinea sp.]|uniref:hypothetical protein n=1 Tax=Caldilinea sp. TaxID=2293560 RepID=UPI002CF7A95D|nr:hypothetical protein [Caldilinea sp.]
MTVTETWTFVFEDEAQTSATAQPIETPALAPASALLPDTSLATPEAPPAGDDPLQSGREFESGA